MMKRSLDSSDSLGGLISICPSTDPTEEHSPGGGDNHVHVYSRELGSMLDKEGAMEEGGFVREKKRRLSVEQVKALEKHFEVENKLEPERKTKLAHELGLQPRQVAVWFQNRRARWKTKQLEKDYGILKSTFDSLRDDFHSLQQENQSLKQKIRELKSKLGEENTECGVSIKEEEEAVAKAVVTPVATTMGSESDSSAVLNSPISASNDDGSLITQQLRMPASSSLGLNCSSTTSPPSITYFNLSESSGGEVLPFVKMEEHDFLGEEGCNFFPEDEAPSLHWYYSPDDQWTS